MVMRVTSRLKSIISNKQIIHRYKNNMNQVNGRGKMFFVACEQLQCTMERQLLTDFVFYLSTFLSTPQNDTTKHYNFRS